MKLVATKNLKNNTYNVELQVLDITDTDRERISDFGELAVDVGGIITEKGTEQVYEPIKDPQTKIETQKQNVPETELVFEADGITPVLEADGITQKTQEVLVEKEVEVQVPVLDGEGNPVLVDRLGDDGKPIYQLVTKEIEVVLADLGKQLRQFPSDFPIKVAFSANEYGDKAEGVALAYIDLVKQNLETKLAELEGKEDTFSGKTEFQL